MADFSQFLPILLKFEGGYTNDTFDPGGATCKGVTLKTFQSCAQTLLGLEPTIDNLKALTDEQAGRIYKPLYWDRVHGDEIALQELANIICDFYVNAGQHATILLQSVMNRVGAAPAIMVDGIIGSGTISALEKLDQAAVYHSWLPLTQSCRNSSTDG